MIDVLIVGLFHRIDSSSSGSRSASEIRRFRSLLHSSRQRPTIRGQEHLARIHFFSPGPCRRFRAADESPLAMCRGEPPREDSAPDRRQTYSSRSLLRALGCKNRPAPLPGRMYLSMFLLCCFLLGPLLCTVTFYHATLCVSALFAVIPVREFAGPPVRGAASPRRVRPTSYLSES